MKRVFIILMTTSFIAFETYLWFSPKHMACGDMIGSGIAKNTHLCKEFYYEALVFFITLNSFLILTFIFCYLIRWELWDKFLPENSRYLQENPDARRQD